MPKYLLTSGIVEKIIETEEKLTIDSFFEIPHDSLRWRVRKELEESSE